MPDAWTIIRAAARDRASGAAEIARMSADALAGIPERDVPRAIRGLLLGHPEMAPLWRLANEVLRGPDPDAGAQRFLAILEDDQDAGASLSRRLPPWILTVSCSSSVVGALSARRTRLVTCMRSTPGGEGARMAEMLESMGCRARVIDDDEALRTLPSPVVLVGANAVTPTAVVNKVKTRALAEAALERGTPCYAVAGETKFVGAELPAEGRFERVPLNLFTAIATPEGLLEPELAAEHAASVRLGPELHRILAAVGGRS